MKRATSCFLYLSLFLLMTVGCTNQAARVPTQKPGPSIALDDCQISSPGMQYSISARCGKLPVYEDQAQKTGRKIDLNLAVIPAVSKTPQTDALFLLAGGPGQAATEAFPAFIPVLDRLHQKRDIVLVDQRGTGKSNPLRCPTEEETPGEPGGGDYSPEKQGQVLKDCLARLGADTRLYTTAATVEDLEQVRIALGYDRVNLIGVSYGTRVAQAYQRQYPQHTRTVTLDSVAPLDWQIGPENSANAQRALDLVFDRCTADKACNAAFPDVRKEFSTLLANTAKQPVEVFLPHPRSGEMTKVSLTSDKIATTIQILTYTPETVAYIPLLIHQTAARGEYTLMAAQYLIVSGDLGESIFDGLYLSVLCAEDVPFYPSAPAQVSSYLPDRTGEMAKQCALWPHAEIAKDFGQPLKSEVPTLLLSGEADPITPPSNAEEVASNLSHQLNLVVPGIGHNVIYRGCVPKVLTSFIDTGSVSGLDTSCVADVRPAPFMINFSGSTP